MAKQIVLEFSDEEAKDLDILLQSARGTSPNITTEVYLKAILMGTAWQLKRAIMVKPFLA
jgi:hypothetical protein